MIRCEHPSHHYREWTSWPSLYFYRVWTSRPLPLGVNFMTVTVGCDLHDHHYSVNIMTITKGCELHDHHNRVWISWPRLNGVNVLHDHLNRVWTSSLSLQGVNFMTITIAIHNRVWTSWPSLYGVNLMTGTIGCQLDDWQDVNCNDKCYRVLTSWQSLPFPKIPFVSQSLTAKVHSVTVPEM